MQFSGKTLLYCAALLCGGYGQSAGRREWFVLWWLFDVDSSAPVNDHRSFSWVTFTLLTRCQAELSILFLPATPTPPEDCSSRAVEDLLLHLPGM